MRQIIPYRSDIPFRLIFFLARGNPYYTGVIYFVLSYAVLSLLWLATGRSMRAPAVDHVNIGVLAPIGAGLLCHFYNVVTSSFEAIATRGIIRRDGQGDYLKFLPRLEGLYNNWYVTGAALLASLLLNGWNYMAKKDSWLGLNGGAVAIYGRLFITLNFYIIGVMVYKSIITVWALRRVLEHHKIVVRPLHPDRCGGLRPIGRLSLAVNYFVGLVMLYFALAFLFDPLARLNPLYVGLYAGFYVGCPLLLFASLSKAHRKMAEEKQRVLGRLSKAFDHYYAQLVTGPPDEALDLACAESVSRTYDLYEVAARMPVWPFDVRSLVRILGTYVLPAIVFAVDQLSSPDSVVRDLYGAARTFLEP
ncbi:MAG TPA: hypothetical protein VM238_18030 [Phycisphaerae bacterium]|nr:hypothetical protein [Phycisphaerae bacterium]